MWELNCEEGWVPKNWCFWTVVLEKTLESPLDCKETQPVHSEGDQPWDFFGRNDAKAEAPVLWPPHAKSWLIGKDWCWEGLGAGGEGDNRGWDGWMASLTRWTWVWVNSRSWWWTGRPGVLWFMGSQRVGHDWGTELNWTEATWFFKKMGVPHSDREKNQGLQLLTPHSLLKMQKGWTERWTSRALGILGQQNSSVWYYDGGRLSASICSNPENTQHQEWTQCKLWPLRDNDVSVEGHRL